MSFTIGQKDKSPSPSPLKNPLDEINDPKRHDELESGGMIVGPNHPGFKGEGKEKSTHPEEAPYGARFDPIMPNDTFKEEKSEGLTRPLRLPSGGAPHGARFDPITPDDTSRLDRHGKYGSEPVAEPDHDEFPPPPFAQPGVPEPSSSEPPMNPNFGSGGRGFGGGLGGPPI